jgi:hypothetical protein
MNEFHKDLSIKMTVRVRYKHSRTYDLKFSQRYLLRYNAVYPLKVNQSFGGKCRLHSQDRSSACYLLHAGYLLSLFFDPEHGGDMLF